jgi:hypothetical protein
MDIALRRAGSGPITALTDASPRRLLDGQYALIAMIVGVTWLALIGAALSSYILTEGSGGGAGHHSLPSYAAYNTQEAAPTSFGSLLVTRSELTPVGDSVEVHVSMRVDNNQDAQIDAPRLEDLRLIDTHEAEANPKPGAWRGPAVLIAHSSATVDLTYLAPQDVGLLWLEYRDPAGQWPVRVVLGSAGAA